MTLVVNARRRKAWPQGTREGALQHPGPRRPLAFSLALSLNHPQRETERTPEKDRKEKKGGEMASQTEFAEPLHSLCDFREVSALAPSALNHVRQKCEAGKACRLQSSAPISARFAHKGTAFSPSTCSHFGICSWGFTGYIRQSGREDCEVHPRTRTFLNP